MKVSFSIFTGLFLALAICLTGTLAQDNAPKMIKGGVLNGRATSLPKPLYPEEAKKDGAEGPVSVTVTIDEEGHVIEAKAAAEYKVAGTVNDNGEPEMKPIHPALREAAETAARAAKFSPTKLSGYPIKVTGTIVYNFAAAGEPEAAREISKFTVATAPNLAAVNNVPDYQGPASETPSNGMPTGEIPKQISGGVLNGKARTLPKPEYPETARAAGVSGAVAVRVLIDEGGNIISASAVSGHQLLRAAAVDAALRAEFAPTRLSGHPVKVSGILTYNFVLSPKDN
jgi:TonB family protein